MEQTTTGNSTEVSESQRIRQQFPSHGRLIGTWMERTLVHGPGPVIGQPYRLQRFQREFLHEIYRYDPETGLFVTRKALLGVAKGNAKTELLAAVGLANLAGPLAPASPNIAIAAASYKQAGILYGTARVMVEEGPLNPFIECLEYELSLIQGTGKLYRVAAEAGTNDGERPTTFVADELHEWTGRKERVHLVIGNGLGKSPDGLEVNISTAGLEREGTLLGELFDYGQKIDAGEKVDPTFYSKWFAADKALNLEDPEQLLEAIRQANPGAGIFWPIDNVVRRRTAPGVKEYEYRRYHLNQWDVGTVESWLPPDAWDLLRSDRRLTKGERICIGLDGSYNGDATALIAATVEGAPHVQVIGVWERPDNAPDDWTVPVLEVEQAIRDACIEFDVVEVACDPYRWQRSIDILSEERLPMVVFSQTAASMSPATVQFMEAVGNAQLSHDGDPRLRRHVANGVIKDDGRGPRLTKKTKNSKRLIDLAVASVMAHARARHNAKKPAATSGFVSLADYID